MEVINSINYIEFKAHDLVKIKAFYTTTFGCTFTDYGPTCTAFSDSVIAGGFEYTDQPIVNGVQVILGHTNHEAIKKRSMKQGDKLYLKRFLFQAEDSFILKTQPEMSSPFGQKPNF